ncbi:hypothetical protein AGMMS49940_03360 [Spirochaetia bacterium]|nr:hypothetical protein AGMMS49940_03360 [Spirochaetia bacterium]
MQRLVFIGITQKTLDVAALSKWDAKTTVFINLVMSILEGLLATGGPGVLMLFGWWK